MGVRTRGIPRQAGVLVRPTLDTADPNTRSVRRANCDGQCFVVKWGRPEQVSLPARGEELIVVEVNEQYVAKLQRENKTG